MTIFAIDPGLTIGYASYRDDDNCSWGQTEDPQHILRWIEEKFKPGDTVLVENYISAGHLTKEAMHTIRLVGLFEGFAKYWVGVYDWTQNTEQMTVKLAAPQKRLSGVARATTIVGDDRKNLYRGGRDAIAALAHAIVHARTIDA